MPDLTRYMQAAVLAVATSLATGLAIIPGSVENAQANSCSDNSQATAASNEGDGEEQNTEAAAVIECDLTGVVIEETIEQAPPFAITEEEAEATEDSEFE
jgi:hypothetical protein